MRPDHVLITGATGNLGGEILARVLDELRPARVTVLIRGPHDGAVALRLSDLAQRMRRRRPELDLSPLSAVRADLRGLNLALERCVADGLGATVDAIVHSAASIQLAQSAETAQETNVRGTESILSFATRCPRLVRMVHLSTAYVAGDRVGSVREDELDRGQGFLNSYERSKFDAETEVRRRMADLPITVVRPSIVVGDSTDGHASASTAIVPVLRHVASGRLRQFPGWGSTRLDLVPIDYVADAVLLLLCGPQADGGTFHVTAGPEGSITARRLFELTIDEFGRCPERALRFWGDEAPVALPKSHRLYAELRWFLDYLLYDKVFDDSGFRGLAGTGMRRCPSPETYLRIVLAAALGRGRERRGPWAEALGHEVRLSDAGVA